MDTSSSFPTTLDTFWSLVNRRTIAASISGETFTVPAGSPYDYVLTEVPQNGSLALTGVPLGGAGSFTLQSTVPAASGEVQVNYATGRLTFHSTDAGTAVSADYDGLGSALAAEHILKVYNALVAVEASLGAGFVPVGYADLDAYLQSELGNLLAEAESPAATGFNINGGACFINRNTRVTLVDTAIDLTTGTYQFPATTLNYYRRALFTINSAGTVNVFWSGENAVSGSLVNPSRPVNEFPICYVTCRNNNISALAGNVNVVNPGDITDVRHMLNLEYDSESDGLFCEQSPVAADTIKVWGGTYFRRSSAGVVTRIVRADYTLDLGTGGAEETTAITATHWNVMLLTLSSTGVITTYEGTSAAAKGSVIPPAIPRYDELPVAMIFFQDNGSAGAGTINAIAQADVHNLFPVRLIEEEPTSAIPDQVIADVDDVRVRAQTVNDKTVEIEPGYISGESGVLPTLYVGDTVDFGSVGTHQKTVAGTNWLPVVLTLTRDLTTVKSYDGTAAASKGAATIPVPPSNEIILALVFVQGDGTGLAGAIENVTSADVTDMREFLRAKPWFHDQNGLRVRQNGIADGTVIIEPGFAWFDSPAYVQVSVASALDIAGGLTIALSPNFYKWILVTLDADGVLDIVEPAGVGAAASVDAPMPTFLTTKRNLAMVLVQDDGTGGVGTIDPITNSVIWNQFQPVMDRKHVEDWFAVDYATVYTITHGLGRIPRSVSVLWQSTVSGGVDTATDISLVTGLSFLNSGFSVIEMTTTTIKIRTAPAYVQAYYTAAGTLTQEQDGFYKVTVA